MLCSTVQPGGIGEYLDPEGFSSRLELGLEKRGQPEHRRAVSHAVFHLLSLFETCGSVYGSVILEERFSRMYVLAPGRIAIELLPEVVSSLTQPTTAIEDRPATSYQSLYDSDGAIRSRLALSVTHGEQLHKVEPEWYYVVRGPNAELPTHPDEWHKQVAVVSSSIQRLVDFFAASVVRLGSLDAEKDLPRLPTPIQDRAVALIGSVLRAKLPPELVNRIAQESWPSVPHYPEEYRKAKSDTHSESTDESESDGSETPDMSTVDDGSPVNGSYDTELP